MAFLVSRMSSANPSPELTRQGPVRKLSRENQGQENAAFDFLPEVANPEKTDETVVSFVIKDPLSEEGTLGKADESQENGYIKSMLLSTLYAIVLILLGLAFPLAEALQHEWLSSHEIGLFLTYLFLGSTIFLVYLQLDLYLETRKERKAKEMDKNKTQKPSIPNSDKATPRDSESTKQKDILLLHLRKLSPGSRPDNLCDNINNVDKVNNAEHSELNMLRQIEHRPRGSLPTVIVNGPDSICNNHPPQPENAANISDPDHVLEDSIQNTSGDTNVKNNGLNNVRNRFNGSTQYAAAVNDTGSTVYSEQDDDDAVYEKYVLMEQTATLTHEGSSFYLRLGCLLFGVANFVFVTLEIHFNLNATPECKTDQLIYPHCCQMILLLVQTFFVFKHTHIHVKRRKGLVRFGLLHVLATNLCIWLRVLTKEVVEAFEKQEHSHSALNYESHSDNISCSSEFLHALSPYLFPFVLEYSLIVVAVMGGMYHSLNLRITKDLFASLRKAAQNPPALDKQDEKNHEPSFFSKSHRGLYCGVVLLSATVVSIIVFFYNAEITKNDAAAVEVYYWSDIVIETLLLVAIAIALRQFMFLSVTFNRDNSIDDILLMASLSGLILLHVCILIGSTGFLKEPQTDYELYNMAIAISASVLNIMQGLLQTVFVMDGLQRCAQTDEQHRKKPGRGLVTFLVISNVALWIFKTFQIKELGLTRMEYYFGSIAWPLILNVSLPFMLFFRFHSSVCLADIWVSAYEKETGPKYITL